MILLKNKDKKANIKIGNNIEIKDGNDFPFDLTLYGRSTQATSTNPVSPSPDYPSEIESVGIYNEETGKYGIEVKTTGKNLLNLPDGTYTSKGLTVVISNGIITINGTSTATSFITIPINLDLNSNFSISLNNTAMGDNLTEVRLQISGSNFRSVLLNVANNNIENLSNYGTYTSFMIRVSSGVTITNGIIKPQVELGDITTDYEPYQSSSSLFVLDQPLRSLPNGTKDEVNITNGKSSIVKRTKEFILDENKTTVLDKVLTNTTRFLIYNVTSSMNDYPSAISTHFKYLVDYNSDTEHFYITRNGAMYLFVNKSIASTVDELKTWLSKNNVKFLHELAEPETINLGTVEMPHTYEGISNITNSADTEMIVKYYKKFEFDKILRSGYNIDEQEYEIAKKQMANGKRKKILSSYVDCIIKIDLGLLDNKTYQEYKGQLEDGEYEYWSYKYNQYKKANFILTKPSITTEYAYDDEIGIDDMEITLEKSSDVS